MTFTYILNKISEILSRKGKGSITPNDTFGLLKEITDKVEAVDYNQGRLAVKRSYASIAAMNADTAPTNQENGKKLQYGELVIIANAANASDADNGKIYRWLGTGNGWEFVLKVGSSVAGTVAVDTTGLANAGLTDMQKVAQLSDVTFDLSLDIFKSIGRIESYNTSQEKYSNQPTLDHLWVPEIRINKPGIINKITFAQNISDVFDIKLAICDKPSTMRVLKLYNIILR